MINHFCEGQRVIVHSLGENSPGEFKGVIRGISAVYPEGCIYIVETVDRIREYNEYPYSYFTITSACVKEDVA